jgi:hypothetical protein
MKHCSMDKKVQFPIKRLLLSDKEPQVQLPLLLMLADILTSFTMCAS